MNKDYILWNVYVNIDSMERLERKFYNLHYKYRRFLYTSEKNKTDFRSSTAFISLLNELNEAYEKIHDCSNETKNEFGEYDYPKVAYKVKFDKVNGKNITRKYASVSETNSCRKVSIKHLFEYAPLYIDGELKSKKDKSSKDIDHLTVESSIKDVIFFFKGNRDVFGEYCNPKITFEAVSKLSDFPIDSITELDFNSLIGKEDFEVIKTDFLEKIRKSSKNAVETNG